MTEHPITQSKAATLVNSWFERALPMFQSQGGKLAPAEPGKPAPAVGGPVFPVFSEVAADSVELPSLLPKGLVAGVKVLRVATGGVFALVGAVITENAGKPSQIVNPMLFICELEARQRPSGWGAFQPYGKRINRPNNDGSTTMLTPDPDPEKAVQNVYVRLAQMGEAAEAPAIKAESVVGYVPPHGVFVLPEPGGGYLLMATAVPVTHEQAVAILKALNAKSAAA